MRYHLLSIMCLLQAGTYALPTSTTTTTTAAATSESTSTWDFTSGAITKFPIHASCNATLRRQLERALDETVTLASHARAHILRWGGASPFVQKYFGNGSATATPLGWYTRVAEADRGYMTFRCDDPDRNCATQEGMSSVCSRVSRERGKLTWGHLTVRMGGTLAWHERDAGDGHLPAVVPEEALSRVGVWAGV